MLQARKLKAMVPIAFTAKDVIEWIFDEKTRDVMALAYGYITSTHEQHRFPLNSTRIDVKIANWGNMVAPVLEKVCIDPYKAEPLFTAIREIEAIRIEFAVVRKVVDWFDMNATPSAIRAYWPTILSLAPDCGVPFDMPNTYHEPSGLASMLPMIRRSANTVACALPLPDDTHKGENYLSFDSYHANTSHFDGPSLTSMDVESIFVYF